MKKTGWLVPVFIGTLALIGCEDPSHEGLLKENQATISELESAKNDAEEQVVTLETAKKDAEDKIKKLETAKKDAEDKVTKLETELEDAKKNSKDNIADLEAKLEAAKKEVKDIETDLEAAKEELAESQNNVTKLKTKYVNPLQFDTNKVSGIVVTKAKSGTARYAGLEDDNINLVVLKEDGTSEQAVVIATEKNAQVTEAPAENSDYEEPEYVYEYVSPENNTIAKIMKTVQCTYELNDKEASGYYVVFDGASTFTYEDGTSKTTGALIYVTPEGDERDVFALTGENLYGTKVNYYGVAWGGGELISFDENGNAFFKAITPNGEKLYRYQPVANKLDDLTPAGIAGLEDFSFAVSLDGKYLLITYETKTSRGVKSVKVADKSVYDVFTTDIPKDDCAIVQAVYMDKNHSFYFATSSFGETNDNEINFIHRWNYETKKLDSVKYTPESEYYNADLSWPLDPAEGAGSLILTEEGIFVMQPIDWVGEAYTGSRLIKIIDANGEYIKVEIPSSLKDMKFAPPRYNQDIELDGENPETWYKPAFLTNGKGIAVINKVSKNEDTVYYYSNNQLKNLLAYDTDRLYDITMALSDKSIILDAKNKSAQISKSINLEDGEVTTLKIDGTVLNLLAVKGKSISKNSDSSSKMKLSVTILEQSDIELVNESTETDLKLVASGEYGNYCWSCNGVVLGTNPVFEKTGISSWEKGCYPIYLTATKNGFVYSSFIEVEIK